MFHERQQRLSQSEIKNNRVKLKGSRVISKPPQALGFEQFTTYEIIQLMLFFDSGVGGFRFETPWRFNVKLAERLINILQINERDIGSRTFMFDCENCKIMSPFH